MNPTEAERYLYHNGDLVAHFVDCHKRRRDDDAAAAAAGGEGDSGATGSARCYEEMVEFRKTAEMRDTFSLNFGDGTVAVDGIADTGGDRGVGDEGGDGRERWTAVAAEEEVVGGTGAGGVGGTGGTG